MVEFQKLHQHTDTKPVELQRDGLPKRSTKVSKQLTVGRIGNPAILDEQSWKMEFTHTMHIQKRSFEFSGTESNAYDPRQCLNKKQDTNIYSL